MCSLRYHGDGVSSSITTYMCHRLRKRRDCIFPRRRRSAIKRPSQYMCHLTGARQPWQAQHTQSTLRQHLRTPYRSGDVVDAPNIHNGARLAGPSRTDVRSRQRTRGHRGDSRPQPAGGLTPRGGTRTGRRRTPGTTRTTRRAGIELRLRPSGSRCLQEERIRGSVDRHQRSAGRLKGQRD